MQRKGKEYLHVIMSASESNDNILKNMSNNIYDLVSAISELSVEVANLKLELRRISDNISR